MTKVLFIGKVWPEPGSTAAGTRMVQLLSLFADNGFAVWFGSAASPSQYSFDPVQMGVSSFSVSLNDPAFDGNLRSLDPQIVIFDRFTTEEQFGWRVAEHCPRALRILDTEDLHCLREARTRALGENRQMGKHDLTGEVAKREIASIYRCDLSLIISTYEVELLRDFFAVPAQLLHYLPFLFQPLDNAQVNAWPGFAQRSHFVSLGNFLHAPNADACIYLKEQIWPLISKELPGVEMHVYGAYAGPEVHRLHDPASGFFIKGRAGNSSDVLRSARVCLAPLRTGAGLKGKLAEAMMCGIPSVTTPLGAEGMGGAKGWPGAVAETAGEFAAAAVSIYRSQTLWEDARDRCAPVFNNLFDINSHAPAFLERTCKLAASPKKHREQNFTGAMLMHHLSLSTRWMARYIETKNQLKAQRSKEKTDEEKKNRAV